jgi:hypothetical protein
MTRRIKIGGLLVAGILGLLILSLAALPEGTQADGGLDYTVPTSGFATSVGSPPQVNYKWELPDMDSYDEGIQYCACTPTDLNENMICDADDDPLTPGMQMHPNINNLPEARLIEYWAAADDANGLADIASVWVDVYHPDGSFKYQVDLLPVDCSEIGWFDDSQSPTVIEIHEPLLAAIDTGQMTWEEAEDLVTRCYKGEKLVFKGHGDLHTHQPIGLYLVQAFAVDFGGALSAPLENLFEVLPITYLNIDFSPSGIDWGEMKPGIQRVVSGDEDLATPNKPTVKNGGNVPLFLGLHFTKLEKVGDPSKIVDTFDAKLMGQMIDPIPASVWVWFDLVQLPPCTPKQLDLSVHPPLKLPPGDYVGTLDVKAATELP